MKVKVHPLAEVLSKKLFGIITVPSQEQKRMVNRAIKAAVEFYDDEKVVRVTEENFIGYLAWRELYYGCGVCKGLFSKDSNYCPGCGRKIIWDLS